jgi:hypothetical protein
MNLGCEQFWLAHQQLEMLSATTLTTSATSSQVEQTMMAP